MTTPTACPGKAISATAVTLVVAGARRTVAAQRKLPPELAVAGTRAHYGRNPLWRQPVPHDPDHINRQLREVRDRAEQARRYQQRVDNIARVAEAWKGRGKEAAPGPGGATSPVVWFFGLFGALFGGVLQPFGTDWFIGGFFGFVAAGISAGYLAKSSKGQAVLWVVGLALVLLIVVAIVRA